MNLGWSSSSRWLKRYTKLWIQDRGALGFLSPFRYLSDKLKPENKIDELSLPLPLKWHETSQGQNTRKMDLGCLSFRFSDFGFPLYIEVT